MDEPTSRLSSEECEKLFDTIENLKNKGVGILYVSHRLEEVSRIADRLTVMRDGAVVGIMNKAEITPQTVTAMMIGHELKPTQTSGAARIVSGNRLEVRDLHYGGRLNGVTFDAYGGEVLGIGGLVGAGRTELIRCIYGADKQSCGTIKLNGHDVKKSIAANIANGFGFVPEDRRKEGLIPFQTIERNIAISNYDVLAKKGLVNKRKETAWAKDAIEKGDIRPSDHQMKVANLSGGNQQKVVLGRWLSRDLKVLLLDEPTAGVDVGVKSDIYSAIRKLADGGTIVVVVSSDLPELLSISDRILVMHKGRFFEEFTRDTASQAAILLAASGEWSGKGRLL
jgi:ribose transport system ATP-binding protein